MQIPSAFFFIAKVVDVQKKSEGFIFINPTKNIGKCQNRIFNYCQIKKQQYNMLYTTTNTFLRGRVKFPTGGDHA